MDKLSFVILLVEILATGLLLFALIIDARDEILQEIKKLRASEEPNK